MANRYNFSNAYIFDLVDQQTRVEFQFLPNDATESKAASYVPHDILGRSSPIFAYSGSSARQLSLTLQFLVNPFQDDDSWDITEIKGHINWLRSLVWPDYANGIIQPPHRVMVRLGNVMAMEAVALDYALTLPSGGIWAFDDGGIGPTDAHYYSVKLDFQEVRLIPPDLHQIRAGDSSSDRGLVPNDNSNNNSPDGSSYTTT